MQFNAKTALFLALVAACATCAEAADGDQVAPFFGFMGAMSALVFSCMGAAYGTAKSGVGIASMGVMRPELVMKSIVPVVMAGVLGIYGLIIAVIISTNSACPCPSFDASVVVRARPLWTPPDPIPRRHDPPRAVNPVGYTLFQGYAHLASGLACGLSASPRAWRWDRRRRRGVRANAQQPKLFTGMLLILIFAEALALYGLIVGIILSSSGAAGAAGPE